MIKKENDSIVYEKVIPAHGAEYVSFPESMRPEIGDYLRSQGISRLYSHQAEMFVRPVKEKAWSSRQRQQVAKL